jgi:hypothetical protein
MQTTAVLLINNVILSFMGIHLSASRWGRSQHH